ncbi:hypothetical protein [Paracoccus yeei]|uniref:Uncharacterized protein n=1 Tax=Paracoccus yeei TaxID=147645 RepID=A0A2D2C2N3_9RHOB|nr:hypothetical protein [Paracoccus yeei]ATQ56757.1 hypothetical protein PYTT13_13780 [Paracoccus yeei]
MSIMKKLAVLREQHYGLEKLPETIRVPAIGDRPNETVKPVGTATIDDLAFALIGLNERTSALYREIDAVRTLHDEGRKAGALGTDIAVDTLIAAKGGK